MLPTKMRCRGFRRSRMESVALEREVYQDIGGEKHYIPDLNTNTRG